MVSGSQGKSEARWSTRTTPSASSAVVSRSRQDTGAASPAVGRLSRRSGRRIAASAMLETALHSHLAARGAVHAAERGVVLPRRFGDDPAAEYAALREGASVVDLGFRTLVRATGADRATFLQGMLTNDVASLVPGTGCAALLLTIHGPVTADVRVVVDEEAVLLDVDGRARDALIGALEKLIIAADVELLEPAEPLALIAVEGPAGGN